MLKITLKLFADLRRHLPAGADGHVAGLVVAPGSTAGDLLLSLGVSLGEELIILVNGRHEELGYELEEGDTLAVFPPLAGG